MHASAHALGTYFFLPGMWVVHITYGCRDRTSEAISLLLFSWFADRWRPRKIINNREIVAGFPHQSALCVPVLRSMGGLGEIDHNSRTRLKKSSRRALHCEGSVGYRASWLGDLHWRSKWSGKRAMLLFYSICRIRINVLWAVQLTSKKVIWELRPWQVSVSSMPTCRVNF